MKANYLEELDVRVASRSDELALSRMLELYQHDISDAWDQDLDDRGQYGYDLDQYWEDPQSKAFMFSVNGRHAGFALVNDSVTFATNQHWMAQFFVLKKYRRRGNGAQAARIVFDSLRGKWEVGQMPLNINARSFWEGVIRDYTGGDFQEHHLDDVRWHGSLQCFDNT